MANELVKTYTASDGQEITLNPSIMARWVLGGADNVPEQEYAKVIMTCAARGLNPLAGDVAIQPHWNKRKCCNELSVVMTKDYFQRRAAMHPSYDGKEAGIVVLTQDGRPVRREGSGLYKALGETLLAGWCKVHVKGRSVPEYKEVSFDEYNTGMSLWNTKPATMVMKVAISQALRDAFPNEFQGLYEAEEMGLDVNAQGEVVERPRSVEIQEDGGGVERVPLYEEPQPMDDAQRMALVEEVAAREYEPTPEELRAEIRDIRKDYEPGWEAF